MNEAYKNLLERRSVRKYNDKKVSHDLVEKIVYAGQFAPSGMNRQIYAFVVVEDGETRLMSLDNNINMIDNILTITPKVIEKLQKLSQNNKQS